MEDDRTRGIPLEDLPDDPLTMPPPYWRSAGAVFHIMSALDDVRSLLEDWTPLHERTERRLDEYFESHSQEDIEGDNDEDLTEFILIVEDLELLEHKIRLKCEIAILMSAIAAEDRLNMQCVYNLHKDIADSIEKLSPAEKLLIVAATLTGANIKSDRIYEATRKLSSWRNAFAHGHCTDRPVKSLRHNHLIHPSEYQNAEGAITEMKGLVWGYVLLSDYLASISKNPYTSGKSSEVEEIREHLVHIRRYRFPKSRTV